MFNRLFKQKSTLVITLPNGGVECADARAVKRWIYSNGKRGSYYQVREVSEQGELLNEYLYKFTESGPIFSKKIYSLWNELKAEAKAAQLQLF